MNLDLVLPNKASMNEEVRNVLALITLELDNLAKLLVMHNIAIAAELFLEVFEDLGIAVLFLKALDSGQAFSTITLLNTYVHVFLCSSSSSSVLSICISKRIKGSGDLNFKI